MYDRREVQEAIDAGERALNSLTRAQEKLDSARTWGLVDLFGGGFMSGVIKHSRMEDASRYIEDARRDLQMFQRELLDVRVPMDIQVEVGGFLRFADYFFDGVAADYLVQSKIADARRQVAEAINQVNLLLTRLQGMTCE